MFDHFVKFTLKELRELVKICELRTLAEEIVREQILEKCYSGQLKKISLAQKELKHEAIIARGSKSAIKEFRLLPGYETKNHVINVDWLNNRNKHSRNHNNESFKCYWCGGEGHKPA